ncbi:hypothetical protein F3L20_17575 [Streptomyces tendae]|uniref:Uncharacterized protein n=1 Tax=Streptomyces tendae TaxID=1932 RepID=A0ABX5ZS05_STRTE|nr:hypothetical protein F3L20_17575 [Streptomyces tendae]
MEKRGGHEGGTPPGREGADRPGGGWGRPAAERVRPGGRCVNTGRRRGRSRGAGRSGRRCAALTGPPRAESPGPTLSVQGGKSGPRRERSRRGTARRAPHAVRQAVPFSRNAFGCAKVPL